MNLSFRLIVSLSLALVLAIVADAHKAKAKIDASSIAQDEPIAQDRATDEPELSSIFSFAQRSRQPSLISLFCPALTMLLNWRNAFLSQPLLGASADTQVPQESGVVLVLAEDELGTEPKTRHTRQDKQLPKEGIMPTLSEFLQPLTTLGQPNLLRQMIAEQQESLQKMRLDRLLSQTLDNLQQQQQTLGEIFQSDFVQSPLQRLGESIQEAAAKLAENFEKNRATANLGQFLQQRPLFGQAQNTPLGLLGQQQNGIDLKEALQKIFPADVFKNTGQKLRQAFPWAAKDGGLFGGLRQPGSDGSLLGPLGLFSRKREAAWDEGVESHAADSAQSNDAEDSDAMTACAEESQISEVRVKPEPENKTPSEQMSEMELHAKLHEVSKKKNLPILWFSHLPGDLREQRNQKHESHSTEEDLETEAKLLTFERKVIQELQLLQELERQAQELRSVAQQRNPTEKIPYKLKYVLGKTPVHKITRNDVEKALQDDYLQKLLQKAAKNAAGNAKTASHSSSVESLTSKRQTDMKKFSKAELLKMMAYALRRIRKNDKDSLLQRTPKDQSLPEHASVEDQQHQMAMIQQQLQPLPLQFNDYSNLMAQTQSAVQDPLQPTFYANKQLPEMDFGHWMVDGNNVGMLKQVDSRDYEPLLVHPQSQIGAMTVEDAQIPEMHSRYWMDMKNLEMLRTSKLLSLPQQQAMHMEHQMMPLSPLWHHVHPTTTPQGTPSERTEDVPTQWTTSEPAMIPVPLPSNPYSPVPLHSLLTPSLMQQQGRTMDELQQLRDENDAMMFLDEQTPADLEQPFLGAAPQMKEHESQAWVKSNLFGILPNDPVYNQFRLNPSIQAGRIGYYFDLLKGLVNKQTTSKATGGNYYHDSTGLKHPGSSGSGVYGNGAAGSNAYGTTEQRSLNPLEELHQTPADQNMQMLVTSLPNLIPSVQPAATHSPYDSPRTSQATGPTRETPSPVAEVPISPETSPEVGISLFGFDPLILRPFMGLHSTERPDDPWLHKPYDLHRPLFKNDASYEAYLKPDARFNSAIECDGAFCAGSKELRAMLPNSIQLNAPFERRQLFYDRLQPIC